SPFIYSDSEAVDVKSEIGEISEEESATLKNKKGNAIEETEYDSKKKSNNLQPERAKKKKAKSNTKILLALDVEHSLEASYISETPVVELISTSKSITVKTKAADEVLDNNVPKSTLNSKPIAEDDDGNLEKTPRGTKENKEAASTEKVTEEVEKEITALSDEKASENNENPPQEFHMDMRLSEDMLRSVVEKSKLIPDTMLKKNQEKFLNEIHNLMIFFRDVGRYYIDAKPLRDSFINGVAQSIQITNDKLYISKEYLESILDIPSETVHTLKESHRRFVEEEIPKLFRLLDTFGGVTRRDKEWKTYDNSRGYVMVASGKYLWMAYLSIKQLRATGAKLPVEIFIPTSKDYDTRFCNSILPKYNARCTIYSADLELELEQLFEIGERQKSILALLHSKFESVLYLDPEDVPLTNLDTIFDTRAFQENGLIFWPDVWSRTTSPIFYNIALVPIYQNKVRYSSYDHADWKRKELDEMPGPDYYNFENTHYHSFEGTMPDPTMQNGAFVVNKTKHLKTLLLALYYHVQGDKYYYPLFSQGANVHPELEALAIAAHVLEMPSFVVQRNFDWFGYASKKDSQIRAYAYGHFDPDGTEQVVFLHLKSPKLFPELLGEKEDDLVYTSGPAKGEHIRKFEHINARIGYDFDLRMFQFLTQALCANYYDPKSGKPIDGTPGVDKSEYMGSHIKYLGLNVMENKKLCTQLFIPHLQGLKKTTEYPNTIINEKKV
ncbi:uncharacterized protein KQ657_000091, partial [Scheffersomyces spartinae]